MTFDPSRNLMPGQMLFVDGGGNLQVVSASNPLPVTGGGGGGGGGSVTQGTSPWVENLAFVGGTAFALGQAAKAGSLPVTLASDQGGLPVTGAFWQATQPVSGAFWQTTQPISATALPLPTGAALDASVQAVVTALGVPLKVNIQPGAGSTLAITPVSGMAVSSLLGKNAAGNLFGLSAIQNASTAGFIVVINAAAVPAASAAITPLRAVFVAAGASATIEFDTADRYSNGIVVLSTTSLSTFTANTAQFLSSKVM